MNIVFLDSKTIGDINLDIFKKFGNFYKYDSTKKSELEKRVIDADIIITNKIYLGEEEMSLAKNLKLILISATGYNNVDLKVAKELGVKVANVAGYSTESVTQMVFTYIFTYYSSIFNYKCHADMLDIKDIWKEV